MGSGVSKPKSKGGDMVLTKENCVEGLCLITQQLQTTPILRKDLVNRNVDDFYNIRHDDVKGKGGTSVVLGCTEKASGRN